jgi:hypothetical protein
LAISGYDIPGEVYSWVIVFILPINSAVNPILYTLSVIRSQRDLTSGQTSKVRSTTSGILFYISSYRDIITNNYCLLETIVCVGLEAEHPSEAPICIKDHVGLMQVSRQIVTIVDRIHKSQLIFGNLDLKTLTLMESEVSQVKYIMQLVLVSNAMFETSGWPLCQRAQFVATDGRQK